VNAGEEYLQALEPLLALDPDAVNVKAKTGERVGAIGRAEAIGCQAVVLIDRQSEEAGGPVS